MAARKDPRYHAKGQVFIAEVPNTEAVIHNLSAGGLCITSSQFIDIIPNTKYQIDVVPEEESNLDKFTIDAESRWIRTKTQHSESGFVIVIPPGKSGKDLFDKYLEYLAQNSEPIEES
jgi:hypothetical protein